MKLSILPTMFSTKTKTSSIIMIMMMQVLATESASYLYSEQDITEINMPGSWKPGNSGKSERIDAYSPPAADGPFPVYVWLAGTLGTHWSGEYSI